MPGPTKGFKNPGFYDAPARTLRNDDDWPIWALMCFAYSPTPTPIWLHSCLHFLPGSDLSCNLAYLGRGKRCLNLNLKMTSAVEIVHRLIKKYDIVIEQFRPGVMAKLGLGYEDLKTVNPSLIYCSLTGYGQTGPLKNRAGHDINYSSPFRTHELLGNKR